MQKNKSYKTLLLWVCFLALGWLTACAQTPPTATSLPPTASAAPPTITAPTPTAAPTATPKPPTLLLVTGENPDSNLLNAIQPPLETVAQANQMQLVVLPTLSPTEIGSEVNLVVAFSSESDLNALIASWPQIPFLSLSISGLAEAPNLSQIGKQGEQPELAAFAAGYLAAMLTDNWRTAALLPTKNSSTQIIQEGFTNGAAYYCGLCRPAFPPFVNYPLFSLQPEDTEDNWRTVLESLAQNNVQTIYLPDGIQSKALYTALSQTDYQIIGTSSPPENLQSQWIATIAPDYAAQIATWAQTLLDGQPAFTLPIPLHILNINPVLLSPGRQHNAENMIDDLLNGWISALNVP